MNEFKGTKGIWEVIKSTCHETKVMCGNIRIAEAKHYNCGYDDWTVNDPIELEGKANAKLISKAPEMLEMLKHLLSLKHAKDLDGKTPYYLDEMPKAWGKTEKLIKEATEINKKL